MRSLTLTDSAIPGLAPPQSFPLPFETNIKLWQLSFNTLNDLPGLLTKGRERELFDWLFKHKAVYPERVAVANRERYVDCYANPGGMSRSFAYYRATKMSASQNLAFSKDKLPMPVLALRGSGGMGDNLRKAMEPQGIDVDGGAIEDCGHYVMEEQPEILARRLLDFFSRVEGDRR